MANRYELAVAITGDAKGAVNAAKLTKDELARLAQSANQQMRKIQQSSNLATQGLNQLKNALGGIGIAAFAKEVLDVNRQFQTLKTSLVTVTGSVQSAEKAFKGIQSFASSTPYTVDQITDSFIKLKALGLDPSAKALTAYGNTASAMGKSLNQIIEAVADASVGEFERLKEFGIKASSEADQVTFTFQGVSTTVKKSADEIQNYLKQIGEVNFAGGMVRQMQTIDGALSNLSDAWSQFLDNLLNSESENAITGFINSLASGLKSIDTVFVSVFASLDIFRANVEYAFNYAVLQVTAAFKSIVQAAMDSLAGFSDLLARGASAVGLDKMANSLRNFSVSLSAGVPASVELEQGIARLNTQLDAEEKNIRAAYQSHLDYKQSLDDQTDALSDNATVKKQIAGADDALSKAAQKTADAFQSQAESLTQQYLALTEGERAAYAYSLTLQGFNQDQQASLLAIYDTNKALEANKKAQEDAADAAKKAADEQAKAIQKAREDAEREQQRLIKTLSYELSYAFDELLFSGQSFTESLANMFDRMLQRMLQSALDFASNQIIQGLFSGNWLQSVSGLAIGGLAIGASYLFGGSKSRSDIKESRTTTAGDDRGYGYAQQVAADIASRDRFYALQIEAFRQMQQELKTSVSAFSNALFSSKDTLFSWTDTISSGISDVIGDSFSSLFNTSGASSNIDGASSGKLSGIVSVLGAAYGVYSLIANWKELSTANKVINTINMLASTITTGITVAAQAGVAAAQSLASTVPVVGWVVAGLAAAYQGITAALDGNQRLATDYFTTAGFGGMNRSMFGNVGGGIVNALTVGPASLISGLFSKPKPPKLNIDTTFSERALGLREDQVTDPGELRYKQIEGTDFYYKDKGGRLAVQTPFGRTGFQARNFDMSKKDMMESFGDLLLGIKAVDTELADKINEIDFAQGRKVINYWSQEVGETMDYYDQWLLGIARERGKFFNQKQKAEKFESAKALEFRYDKIFDVLGESGTEVGTVLNTWYDALSDKFGPENTLSLVQVLTASVDALLLFPTDLADLVADRIKAFDLGGTPDDAFKEIITVLTTFATLQTALGELGETDFTDQTLVDFLSYMNSIGFAVEDAAQSMIEYSYVLKALNLDISDGLTQLWEYAKAQEFTNAEMSNFITTVGAFASLSMTLGLSTTLDELTAISYLVGDIAKKNLDNAQAEALAQQASEYSADQPTVEQARTELEKLGIATEDAILDVVNQVTFMDRVLKITGTSFKELGVGLLDTVKGSLTFLENFGGLEEFEKVFQSFFTRFYSEAEQFTVLEQTLTNQVANLGLALPKTREEFKALVEAQDLLTESGRNAYGTLISSSEAFDGYYQYLETQDQKRLESLKLQADKELELMKLQGKELEALAIERERELNALDPVIAAIQALIYAEQDLIKVRENATRVAEQQKSLDIELLKAKGLTLEATTLERQDWVKQMTDQMDKDITDLIQSQQSSFAAIDLQPEDTALSELIRQYVADNNLSTIQEIYKAAQEASIDPYVVGKAFGLNAETTAGFLAESGISGFSVDTDIKNIENSYDNLIKTQQEIWKLNDIAEDTKDTTDKLKDSLDELNAIEQERIRLQDQIDELTLSYTEKLEKQRNALYEVNRPLFDMLHALEVARDQHLLDIRLLEVTGKEEEALNMQRQDQLATMDEQLHATQLAIWAAEDAAKAEQDLADARSTALNDAFKVLQKAVTTEKERLRVEYETNSERIQASIDKLSESVNNLKSLSESLKSTLESLFPVGGDQLLRRQQAQAEIVSAVAIARAGGPLPLLDDLEKALNVIREPSEELFGNFVDYQRDFYKTAISINDLKTLTDDSLSEQETQLDLAKDQLKVLEETYTAEIERLDAILEKYQEQIDAINGVTIAIMTIPEAIANLESVIAGLSFNSGGSSTTTTTPTTPITNLLTPSDSSSLMKNVLMAKLNQATTNQEVSNIASFASKVLPGFAEGGTHTGGWRIVGENGPELEYTAPSHIFSNSQSQSLLNLDELVAEVQALREDVRAGQSAIAANTRKTAKTLDKFDIDGMPEVRT